MTTVGSRRSASSARCAIRRSTTPSTQGIGRRLDGWANRDLNVGAIVALAPRLRASRPARRRCRHRAQGAQQLGPGKVRRRAVARRQGVPARRQLGGDADSAGFRSRGRQSAHLDGLGLGDALERVRRESRDARQGHVLRSAARRRRRVPDRGAREVRPCRRGGGPDHAGARAAALLSARAAGAGAAARQLQPPTRPTRQRALQRQSTVRHLPRAAALHRAGLEHAHAGGDRHRRLPGEPLAGRRYRTAPLRGLWTHRGRLLSRRPLRHAGAT